VLELAHLRPRQTRRKACRIKNINAACQSRVVRERSRRLDLLAENKLWAKQFKLRNLCILPLLLLPFYPSTMFKWLKRKSSTAPGPSIDATGKASDEGGKEETAKGLSKAAPAPLKSSSKSKEKKEKKPKKSASKKIEIEEVRFSH